MRKAFMFMTVILLLGFMVGEAAAARSGGAFNFCIPYGGDVLTLDPHKGARVNDMIVVMSLNRSLYSWDPENNRPKLELGEKADVSPDGLVYRIYLRKDVKFHNGRGMTAGDVIWSYERIMSPKTASISAGSVRVIKGAKDYEDGKADKISGLRKIDNFTLEITMENPVDPAYTLYEIGTAVLPREEVEKKGYDFGSDPVGCGPFKFVKWVKGSEIVLTRSLSDFYVRIWYSRSS